MEVCPGCGHDEVWCFCHSVVGTPPAQETSPIRARTETQARLDVCRARLTLIRYELADLETTLDNLSEVVQAHRPGVTSNLEVFIAHIATQVAVFGEYSRNEGAHALLRSMLCQEEMPPESPPRKTTLSDRLPPLPNVPFFL